jgi:hypothetical protein
MKQKLQKITKTLLFCFVIILSSCEKEGVSTIQNTEAKNNNISIKYVSGKNIPNIISKLNPDYSSTFKSSSSKSNMITDSFGSISIENILEVIDSLGNKNYSFTLSPKKPKPNSIFNLVISTSNGNKDMAIVEYRMAPNFAQDYYNGRKSISEFTGSILRFPFKDASNLFSKTSGNTCIQNIDEVVNCDEIIVDGGNIISSGGGGGSTTISDTNTYTGGDGGTVTSNYGTGGGGSASWVCNRYGVSHSGPTNCGDGSGTWVIILYPDKHTNKLSNPKSKTSGTSCCDDTNLVGTIGVNLFDLAVSIRDILGFSPRSQESLWLINNATNEQIASISNLLEQNNNSTETINFSKELTTQMMLNPALILDANASFKSPFNIDRLSITDVTPEGAKFNFIYNKLIESPEFQNFFLDLFQDPSNRFNVKFVIEDIPDKNGKKINGNTQPQTNGEMLITINKQILTALGTNSLKDIEIARTILHESIHAYLMIKGKNPVSPGIAIPGIENMTLDEVINATFADNIPQHNFMYNHMIPTMQTVLTQIRDLLTTQARRSEVESLRMHPDLANLRNTIPWNWNDYFKYLSLIGLGEANSFKTDFPNPSNEFNLYVEYVIRGHQYLDGN